jgi:hypothetical protein
MHPSLYERDMDLFRTHEKGKASLFPVTYGSRAHVDGDAAGRRQGACQFH